MNYIATGNFGRCAFCGDDVRLLPHWCDRLQERDPSRLYCCSCGADLGPDDGFRDPDCMACLARQEEAELDEAGLAP